MRPTANEYKQIGSAASAGMNAVSLLVFLYQTFRHNDGKAHFKSGDHKDQMRDLLSKYIECFSQSKHSNTVPECLHTEESNSELICPIKLRKSDFTESCFISDFLSDQCKETASTSNVVVTNAKKYVNKREKSPTRRNNIFSSYGGMEEPRYHLMYFVCDRIHKLSMRAIDEDVSKEYEYLHNYLVSIYEQRHIIFKKASRDCGFFITLKSLEESANQLKKITQTYLKRQTIADLLNTLSSKLLLYRNTLAEGFLMNCLSSEENEYPVKISHLQGEHKEMLESSQVDSPIFSIVQSALTKDRVQLKSIISKFKLKIPSSIKKAKIFDVDEIQNQFIQLIILVNKFEYRVKVTQEIRGCAVTFGERLFVTHQDFENGVGRLHHSCKELIKKCEEFTRNIAEVNTYFSDKTARFLHGFRYNCNTAVSSRRSLSSLAENELAPIFLQIEGAIANLKGTPPPDVNEAKKNVLANIDLIENEDMEDGIYYPTEIARASKSSIGLESKQAEDNAIQTQRVNYLFKDEIYDYFKNTPEKLEEFYRHIADIEHEYKLATKYIANIKEIVRLAINLQRLFNCEHRDHCEISKKYKDLEYMIGICRYKDYQFKTLNDRDAEFKIRDKEFNEYILRIQRLLFKNCDLPSKAEKFKKVTALTAFVTGELNQKAVIINDIKIEIDASISILRDLIFDREGEDKDLEKTRGINILDHFSKLKKSQQKNAEINIVEEMHEDKIASLAKQLINTSGQTKDSLKNKLSDFTDSLFNLKYKLHYLGGEKFTHNNETKKLPKNIYLMMKEYNKRYSPTATYKELKDLCDSMLNIAVNAADHPPIRCCGLFQPRDTMTQKLYDDLSYIYHSREEKNNEELIGNPG